MSGSQMRYTTQQNTQVVNHIVIGEKGTFFIFFKCFSMAGRSHAYLFYVYFCRFRLESNFDFTKLGCFQEVHANSYS